MTDDCIMIVPALLLLASSSCIASAQVQDGASNACTPEVVEGLVRHGEVFRAEFGDDLVFLLTPEAASRNPQGWTIQVLRREGGVNDYSAVVTPPYRSSNPRYVHTGYGIGADQAMRWTEREFRYVLNEDDFRRANGALEVLLWPGEHSSEEIAAAEEVMAQVPAGSGILHIVSAQTHEQSSGFPGGLIEGFAFRVDLCVASGPDTGEQ